MNEELKVQIPDGYRWVKAGEVVSELYEQAEGRWVRSARGRTQINWHYITPIEPPKPETVDVKIVKTDSALVAKNPNDGFDYLLHNFPCVVAPAWEFAGFVWDDDGPSTQHYYLVEEHRVKYAKAVRFRRVRRGAK